ncbi:CD1845 family protein [Enterococcus gallinarum]|uniref:CD1845 family protein n=1 Tax=Enterococcus gallinarum TaxID=1353 RepID=A0AAE4HV38_ENTGA|nr:CD1845 family protein [Enterococcus gallinarum]MDT2692103.1 CD1845 family protein [Enterococcus gallinarum]
MGNPSLNHRYRKGFYSLFKTLQQNPLASFIQGEIGIGISGLVIGFLFSPYGLPMIGATVIAFIELINDKIKAV